MLSNEIVYVGDNCGEMTKSDIMEDIEQYVNDVDFFNHLSDEKLIVLKENLYNILLDILTWQSPYTLMLEFDLEDIQELLDGVN